MVFFTKVAGWFAGLHDTARSIQGHVARAARGAVRSGPLRQSDVLHRLQVPEETWKRITSPNKPKWICLPADRCW